MKRKFLLLILACLAKSVYCVDAAQPVHSTRQGREETADSTLVGLCEALEYPCLIGTVLPHPSDCQLYLQCVFPGVGELGVSNNWIVRSCSQGTWFDRRQLFCVLPSGVECAEKCDIKVSSKKRDSTDKQSNSTKTIPKPQVQQTQVLPEISKEDGSFPQVPSSSEDRSLRLAETLYGSLPRDLWSKIPVRDYNSDIEKPMSSSENSQSRRQPQSFPSGLSNEDFFSELYKNFEALGNVPRDGSPWRYEEKEQTQPERRQEQLPEQSQSVGPTPKVRGVDAKQAPVRQGGTGEPFWWTEFNLPHQERGRGGGNVREGPRNPPRPNYQEPKEGRRDNQDPNRPMRNSQNMFGARGNSEDASTEQGFGRPDGRSIERPPRENVYWPPNFQAPSRDEGPDSESNRRLPFQDFDPTPVPIPAPSTLHSLRLQIKPAGRVRSTDTSHLNKAKFVVSTVEPEPRRGTPGGKYTLSRSASTRSPYGGFTRDPIGTTEAPRTIMPWSLFYKLLRKYAMVEDGNTPKEGANYKDPYATTVDPLFASSSEVREKEEFVHPIPDLKKVPLKGRRSSSAPGLTTNPDFGSNTKYLQTGKPEARLVKSPALPSQIKSTTIKNTMQFGEMGNRQEGRADSTALFNNHRAYIDPTREPYSPVRNTLNERWQEAVGVPSSRKGTTDKETSSPFSKVLSTEQLTLEKINMTSTILPQETSPKLSNVDSSKENPSGGSSIDEALRKLANIIPGFNVDELDPELRAELMKKQSSAQILEAVTSPSVGPTSTISNAQATTNTLSSAGTTTDPLLPGSRRQNDTEADVKTKTLRIPLSKFGSMLQNGQGDASLQPSTRAAQRIRELYRYLRRRMRLQGYRPVLKIAEWQTTPVTTRVTTAPSATSNSEDRTTEAIKTSAPEGKSFRQVTQVATNDFTKKDMLQKAIARSSEVQATTSISNNVTPSTTTKRTTNAKSLTRVLDPTTEMATTDSIGSSMTDALKGRDKQGSDSGYDDDNIHTHYTHKVFSRVTPHSIIRQPVKTQATDSMRNNSRHIQVNKQDRRRKEQQKRRRQQQKEHSVIEQDKEEPYGGNEGLRARERTFQEQDREQAAKEQDKDDRTEPKTPEKRNMQKKPNKKPKEPEEKGIPRKTKLKPQKQRPNTEEGKGWEKETDQLMESRETEATTIRSSIQPTLSAQLQNTHGISDTDHISIESEEVEVSGLNADNKSKVIKDVIKDSAEKNTDFSVEGEQDSRDVFHTLSPMHGKAAIPRMQPVTVEYGHVAMPPVHKGDSSSFEMVYSVSKDHEGETNGKSGHEEQLSQENVTLPHAYASTGVSTEADHWKALTFATVPGAMPPHGTHEEMPPLRMHGVLPPSSMHRAMPPHGIQLHAKHGAVQTKDMHDSMASHDMPIEVPSHVSHGHMQSHGLSPERSPHDIPEEMTSHSMSTEMPLHGMPKEIQSRGTPKEMLPNSRPKEMPPHDMDEKTATHGMPTEMPPNGVPEVMKPHGKKGESLPHEIYEAMSPDGTQEAAQPSGVPGAMPPRAKSLHGMHRIIQAHKMHDTLPPSTIPGQQRTHGMWRHKVEHKMLNIPLDSEERDSHLFEHIHPEPIHTQITVTEESVSNVGAKETATATSSGSSKSNASDKAVHKSKESLYKGPTTVASREQSQTKSYHRKIIHGHGLGNLQILSSLRKTKDPATGYSTLKTGDATVSASDAKKYQTTAATSDTTPGSTSRSSGDIASINEPSPHPGFENDEGTLNIMHLDANFHEMANGTENETETSTGIMATTLTVAVHSEGLSIGLIVGVSFVVILLMTIIILPCLFCTVYKKDRRKIKNNFMDHTDITTLASYGTTERNYPSTTMTSVDSYRPLIRTPSWINKILLFKRLNRKSASDHCLVNMYSDRQHSASNDDIFGYHDNRSCPLESMSMDREARNKRKPRQSSSRVENVISDFAGDNAFYLQRPKVKGKHYMPSVV